MKRRFSRVLPLLPLVFAALVTSLFLTAGRAQAYSSVAQCVNCHNFQGSSSPAHQRHLPAVTNSCSTCHVSVGDTPAISKCAACHTAPDLPVRHQGFGVGACVGCHAPPPPPPPNPNDVDNDGDGVTENQGDCNDANAAIRPGAAEIVGNGIDENCNGMADDAPPPPPPPNPNDVDDDGDGVTENQGDCNDANAAIRPGAAEVVGNGIDENCNGMADDNATAPAQCTDGNFDVLRVVYNEYRQALALRGTSGTSTSIRVLDAESGASIGERPIRRGDWRAVLRDVDSAPDSVIVESGTGCTQEVDVRVRERKPRREHRDEDDEDEEGSGGSRNHPFGWSDPRRQHPDYVSDNGVGNCLACHSIAPADKGQPTSCYRCHGREWQEPETQPPSPEPAGHPFGWTDPRRQHPDYAGSNGVGGCLSCHSIASADRGKPLSCYNCHGQEWDAPEAPPPGGEPAGHPFGWSDPRRQHPDYVGSNGVDDCLACHSIASGDRGQPMSCYNCHGQEWDAPENQPPTGGSGGSGGSGGHPFGWSDPEEQHRDYVGDNGVDSCLSCHSTASGDRGRPMSCYNCHGKEW